MTLSLPFVPNNAALPWEPENLRYGIGWQACMGDLTVHVFKLRNVKPGKQPYHYRAELLDRHGHYRIIQNSATDKLQPGAVDFRGAKAQAAQWYRLYRMRGY